MRARQRTPEQVEALDRYLAGYMASVEEVFATIGANNASVLSYYYRINPEISSEVRGFWYSKHDTLGFRKVELTDISSFAVDDYAHVGWFYEPLERGRPSWLNPYENKNIDTYVVSYVIPIYKAGTFIGVMGIDVSHSSLVSKISDLEVLDTGYAFLTDEKGKIVYHPLIESEVLLSDVSSEFEAARSDAASGELISYTFRVGGDEFIALLQGDLVQSVQELEDRFDKEAAAINTLAVCAWEKVNAAHGRAVYNPAIDANVKSVVQRADESMYAHKRRYKESRAGGRSS